MIFFLTLFLDVKTVLLKGTCSKVVRLQFDQVSRGPYWCWDRGVAVGWSSNLQIISAQPDPVNIFMWKSIVHREIRPSEIGIQSNQMNFVQSLCMCASSVHQNSPCPPSSPLSIYSKHIRFLWEWIRSVTIYITSHVAAQVICLLHLGGELSLRRAKVAFNAQVIATLWVSRRQLKWFLGNLGEPSLLSQLRHFAPLFSWWGRGWARKDRPFRGVGKDLYGSGASRQPKKI